MKVFFNGELIDREAARIDPGDRGLTLADGLYETIKVQGGDPLRTDAHLARLRGGAAVIGLVLPDGDLALALKEVAAANNINQGVLRLTLTRGSPRDPHARGILPPLDPQPTLLITGTPQDLTPPEGVRAIIATCTRRNEHSPLSRIKTTNCLDGILAAQEAKQRKADDALLLNTAGNLAEAAVANLFLVLDGRAVTPPIEDGALPGVMRAAVIKALGAAEQTLAPDALENASEAFLTSALGIRPLIEVDGVAIGSGVPGPVVRQAQKA